MHIYRIALPLLAAVTVAVSCAQQPALTKSGLDPAKFAAQTPSGNTALYTMTNASGMEVCVTNFGGRIVSVMVPDKNGESRDVVLGFDNVNDYMTREGNNFGACVGRYANRIANGRTVIAGKEYTFFQNNKTNCLHGGKIGWDMTLFETVEADASHVRLRLVSPDGNEGFPGTVTFYMTYSLSDDNKLTLEYEATTDATTVVSCTNHSYFNLSGDPNNTVLDNILWIDASATTPTDEMQAPTGEIASVEGTPFDFRTPKVVGRDIDCPGDEQLRIGGGWDHNWVLDHPGELENKCAECVCPATGISLAVYTTEPGLQVYSGNFLKGDMVGKKGIAYQKRTAICLETQHFPDSPNHDNFPSTVLNPGEKYQSTTVFAFSVVK